ncbi:MAG: PilZ domain-containing protein [Gaiellales bacterium]
MDHPSPTDLLEALFESGEAVLEFEDGGSVPVTSELIRGDRVLGHAPRLQVGEGRRMSGRANMADGESWLVWLEMDMARYRSPELADVSVRLMAVELHPHRRRANRLSIGGSVWLEALNCQEVVDGDRVDATMVDVSELGVAVSTGRLLRPGDRLIFHGRMFADSVTSEVRVASVRQTEDGRRIAGCSFVDLDPAIRIRIGENVRGERVSEAPQFDVRSLRDAAEPAGGGLFGRRRRRA